MAPQAFLARSSEAVKELNSDYRAIAGMAVSDPATGYQAVLYHGYNTDAGKRDFVLHVANTDPDSDLFEQASVGSRQLDFDDKLERYMQVDGLNLEFFQGVGSLTLELPFRSV